MQDHIVAMMCYELVLRTHLFSIHAGSHCSAANLYVLRRAVARNPTRMRAPQTGTDPVKRMRVRVVLPSTRSNERAYRHSIQCSAHIQSAEELHKILADYEMRFACLLVYANKTDLVRAYDMRSGFGGLGWGLHTSILPMEFRASTRLHELPARWW